LPEDGIAEGLSVRKIAADVNPVSPLETKEFALGINALGWACLDVPASGSEAAPRMRHSRSWSLQLEKPSTPSNHCPG